MRHFTLSVLIAFLFFGCSLFKEKPSYDTPIISSDRLDKQLLKACESSQKKGQPFLLEFSAPWCGDCQRLTVMKSDKELATELQGWDVVVINVGQFDQHTELLEAFKVNAIANWTVVSPAECRRAASEWQQVAQRTLEPKSGEPVTSVELAAWLHTNRVVAHQEPPVEEPKVAETGLMSGIKGLDAAQKQNVEKAIAIDQGLAGKKSESEFLETFAAEGARADIWRDQDGKVMKLIVESKGETYDSVDTVYAVDGVPFFARRFHFFDPSKFDEEGSETYAEAAAARASESLLFFFTEGRVVGVSSSGSLAKIESAKLVDGSLVESPVGAVEGVDPASEDFRVASDSIAATWSAISEKTRD